MITACVIFSGAACTVLLIWAVSDLNHILWEEKRAPVTVDEGEQEPDRQHRP